MTEERLQKILARAGYGSRRANEELILAGRVRVNGNVAELGSKADPQRDTITVDNQPIAKEQAPVYIALNKPRGVLSEVSPEEPRQTVRDLVPVPGHMFIVGRLDLDSEGLILLTNDGDLANRLTHPRYEHEKEYRVLVAARPDPEQMDAWRRGIVLEDGHRTAPAQVNLEGLAGKGAWLRVILHEGHKRQIREMGRLTGLPVVRIVRIRIGTLLLGDLKPGQWRELRPDEVRALRSSKGSQRVGAQRTARSSAGRSAPAQRSGSRSSTRTPATRTPAARTPAGSRGPASGAGTEQRESSRPGKAPRRPPRRGETSTDRDNAQKPASRRPGQGSSRPERGESSSRPGRSGPRRVNRKR